MKLCGVWGIGTADYAVWGGSRSRLVRAEIHEIGLSYRR